MFKKYNNDVKLFQWPEPGYCQFGIENPVYYKYKRNIKNPSVFKIQKIEKFFSEKYKTKYAILFPSGRAAINVILRHHQYDRSKIVNIPLWTSSCLLHSLTAITNVSVKNRKADCIIVVHKWGNTYTLKNNSKTKKQLIIDDSADCFPGKIYKPFENNSHYEILSLPKLIGSFCGGIILTNKTKFYLYCKKQQIKNKILGKAQSERKYKSTFKDQTNFDWRFYESLNTSVDFNSVENIFNCLSNYDLNLNTIIRRQNLIKKYFKNMMIDKKRIGPCLIFDKKKFNKFKSLLESKHYDFTHKALKEKYRECLIFPIHFGISEKNFKKKLNSLIKAEKR